MDIAIRTIKDYLLLRIQIYITCLRNFTLRTSVLWAAMRFKRIDMRLDRDM